MAVNLPPRRLAASMDYFWPNPFSNFVGFGLFMRSKAKLGTSLPSTAPVVASPLLKTSASQTPHCTRPRPRAWPRPRNKFRELLDMFEFLSLEGWLHQIS